MLKRNALAAVLAFALVPLPGLAGPIETMLAKLGPEERSHQACVIKGLDVVRRDPRLRQADRMKTSIFAPAVLAATSLTANGGAVHAGSRWYALSFSCTLTGDYMKATAFSFVLRNEIPQAAWDKYGLWP